MKSKPIAVTIFTWFLAGWTSTASAANFGVSTPSQGSQRTKNSNVAGTGIATSTNLTATFHFGTKVNGIHTSENSLTVLSQSGGAGMPAIWLKDLPPPANSTWTVSPLHQSMRIGDHYAWIDEGGGASIEAETIDHKVTP